MALEQSPQLGWDPQVDQGTLGTFPLLPLCMDPTRVDRVEASHFYGQYYIWLHTKSTGIVATEALEALELEADKGGAQEDTPHPDKSPCLEVLLRMFSTYLAIQKSSTRDLGLKSCSM